MTNLPPTPVSTLERAREIALDAGLNYVYLGNVPFHEGGNTYCHSCGELLIRRVGYATEVVALANGSCGSCNTEIPGVWSQEEALTFRPR
jgi:pyruvate formate lyase activating enzyme